MGGDGRRGKVNGVKGRRGGMGNKRDEEQEAYRRGKGGKKCTCMNNLLLPYNCVGK